MVNQTRSVTINQSVQIGLLNIGYRIMLESSDGTQEEITTLNTFPVRGDVAHQTHTNGKHLGYIYLDVLTGADETYARILNTNDIQLQTTT